MKEASKAGIRGHCHGRAKPHDRASSGQKPRGGGSGRRGRVPGYTPGDAPRSLFDSHLHLFVIRKNAPCPSLHCFPLTSGTPNLGVGCCEFFTQVGRHCKLPCILLSAPAETFPSIPRQGGFFSTCQVLLAAAVQPPCSHLDML